MIIYICSPYSGDTKTNAEKARDYCRFVVGNGDVPIAPHLLFPQFMDEDKDRELALQMDLLLLEKCDELWVFGDEVSSGMKAEIAYASNKGIHIRYFKKEGR